MEEASPEVLQAFILAERRFVEHQQAGEHEMGVKCLECVLKEHQHLVQKLQDTLLSSLFEKLAVGYNTLGMKYLKLGKTDLSLKYFQKSEAVTDPANMHIHHGTRLVLRAVTYNNLGCFYKSMNKLHTSLQYLKKALVIEERALAQRQDKPDTEVAAGSAPTGAQNPAATHLNLCALLSQMSMHEKALYHSQRALQFLEYDSSHVKGESLTPVAYYNMGAEYEHLKYYAEALQAYENAYETSLEELGSGHALSSKIATSVKQLKKKVLSLSAGKKQ